LDAPLELSEHVEVTLCIWYAGQNPRRSKFELWARQTVRDRYQSLGLSFVWGFGVSRVQNGPES